MKGAILEGNADNARDADSNFDEVCNMFFLQHHVWNEAGKMIFLKTQVTYWSFWYFIINRTWDMGQARTRKARAHLLKRYFTCHTLTTDLHQALDFKSEEQHTDWSLSTYAFSLPYRPRRRQLRTDWKEPWLRSGICWEHVSTTRTIASISALKSSTR